MFSSESTCNPHKSIFSGERYIVQKHKPKLSASQTLAPTNWNKRKQYFEVAILIVTEFISIQHLLMILKILMTRIITELVWKMIRI